MKDLTFKLKTNARKVVLVGEDGATESKFEIRELKAAAREKYMDALSRRLQLDPKGNVVGLKKYEGMQADLLTVCMHEDGGALVTKQTLDAWPGNVVEALFREAQTVNLLRKPDERNRILAEQIAEFLEANADVPPTAEQIEGVIEDADKRMFDEGPEDKDA